MKGNELKKAQNQAQPKTQTAQWTVRTGLRGGECQACEEAVQDWRNEYYQYYEQAKYKTV